MKIFLTPGIVLIRRRGRERWRMAHGVISALRLMHAHVARLPSGRLVRRMAPFSTTSSNEDDAGRCGYLQCSLSTLRYYDLVSEVEIAISRELK